MAWAVGLAAGAGAAGRGCAIAADGNASVAAIASNQGTRFKVIRLQPQPGASDQSQYSELTTEIGNVKAEFNPASRAGCGNRGDLRRSPAAVNHIANPGGTIGRLTFTACVGMITITLRHWGDVMRDKSNRLVSFAIVTSTVLMLAPSAWAQVMPLPIGPPLARTDGPSYGPAYPPPQLVRHKPQSNLRTAKAVATSKTSNVSVPATKPKTELKREPERRPTDLRRDRTDNRTTSRQTTPQAVHATSRTPDRGPHRQTQAPKRQAQYSR